MKEINKEKYIVINKTKETHNVITLDLALIDGSLPEYTPGQFINIFFEEFSSPEGKAYSISSSPKEKRFSITIMAIGEFSNKLSSLNVGEIICATLPCGYFFSESQDSHLIMISSGIGITPFRSMIINTDNNRSLSLHSSYRHTSDILFREEMGNISNLNIKYYITREDVTSEYVNHRIHPSEIIRNIKEIKKTEFMVCGSIEFTRDMWRGLKDLGVSEDMIYTEAFFSH